MVTGYFIALNVTLTVVFAVTFTFAVVSPCCPPACIVLPVIAHVSTRYPGFAVAVKVISVSFATLSPAGITGLAVIEPFAPALIVTVQPSVTGGCTSPPLLTFVLQPSTKAATISAVAAKFKNVVFFLCMVFIRFSFKFLKFIIRKKENQNYAFIILN